MGRFRENEGSENFEFKTSEILVGDILSPLQARKARKSPEKVTFPIHGRLTPQFSRFYRGEFSEIMKEARDGDFEPQNFQWGICRAHFKRKNLVKRAIFSPLF